MILKKNYLKHQYLLYLVSNYYSQIVSMLSSQWDFFFVSKDEFFCVDH